MINWSYLVAIILAVLLLLAMVWFVIDIFSLKKQGIFTPATFRMHHSLGAKPALAASQIQGWMTFAYIEHVCHIPQSYLESQLSPNSSIPQNDTLAKYASQNNLDSSVFVESVRKAVVTYQGSSHS